MSVAARARANSKRIQRDQANLGRRGVRPEHGLMHQIKSNPMRTAGLGAGLLLGPNPLSLVLGLGGLLGNKKGNGNFGNFLSSLGDIRFDPNANRPTMGATPAHGGDSGGGDGGASYSPAPLPIQPQPMQSPYAPPMGGKGGAPYAMGGKGGAPGPMPTPRAQMGPPEDVWRI